MNEKLQKFESEIELKSKEMEKNAAELERMRLHWKELVDAGKNAKEHAPKQRKYIFFGAKLCPVCKNQLKKLVTREYDQYDDAMGSVTLKERGIYSCPKCGYEHAYQDK